MTTIRIVNVRGLNKPEQRAAVCYVGRPFAGWPAHPLGNPFRPGGSIADCLDRYRGFLASMPDIEQRLAALWDECERGEKPLGCWCVSAAAGDGSPCVCHAQVIAEMLRERFAKADSSSLT